jgi:hypothetical protein
MEEKVMDQPKELAVGGDEAHVEPALTNAEGRCHGQTGQTVKKMTLGSTDLSKKRRD